MTLVKAGDYIDNQLLERIQKKYQGAQVTKDMARRWKEQFAFVGPAPSEPILVDFSIQGKAQKLDITSEVRGACESIVPDYVKAIKQMIMETDPEFQEEVRGNVLLAGGGCGIRNLGEFLREELEDIGEVNITNVSDLTKKPDHLVAQGALNLAQNMPEKYWEKLI